MTHWYLLQKGGLYMNINESILECCKSVIEANNEQIMVNESTLISRENGIDSLAMVTLVIDIEEKFNIDLDEHLSEIRKCKTIGQLIEIVTEVVLEYK